MAAATTGQALNSSFSAENSLSGSGDLPGLPKQETGLKESQVHQGLRKCSPDPSRTFSRVDLASDYPSTPLQYPQVGGGATSQFHQAWVARGSNPWIVSILQEGYHLELRGLLLLSSFVPGITASKNPTKMEILQEQFDTLLEKGALESIPSTAGPSFLADPKKFPRICSKELHRGLPYH